MGCCGQKRAGYTGTTPTRRLNPNLPANTSPSSIVRRPVASPTPALPSTPTYPSVALRYTEMSPILVKGPATGRQYQFSGSNAIQAVDARDAVALLRTRFFVQST
jgi:hypothetical protein